MKFIRIFSFFLLSAVIFSGCSAAYNAGNEIPQIDVTANETSILCVGVQSDTSPDLSELSNFKSIMNESDDLPYVKLGETIELKLGFAASEGKIKIYDRILSNDGSDKYAASAINVIDGNLTDNKIVFDLEENKAALASSDSADYAPGATVRGFSFSVEIGEKNYIYAFALRTDAK